MLRISQESTPEVLRREPEEEKPISVRNHPALLDLGRTDTRKGGVRNVEIVGNLYTSSKKTASIAETGQTRIIFESMENMRLDAGTDKLLTYLLSTIPESSFYNPLEVAPAHTTVSDYMKLRGLKDRKEARRAINKDLNALSIVHLHSVDDDDFSFVGIPIAGDKYELDHNGNITFTFSPTFKRGYLLSSDSFPLNLDPAAWKTNDRNNPHAWHIYRKLLAHYGANEGEQNEYLLSVKKLLDYVTTIPRPERVAETSRGHETDEIIAPLERDLDALVSLGVLIDWEYRHSHGKELSPAEEAARTRPDGSRGPMPYAIAKDLYITWGFVHEYNREKRLEAKEKHRKKLQAAETERKAEAAARGKRIQAKAENKAAKIVAERLAEETLADM